MKKVFKDLGILCGLILVAFSPIVIVGCGPAPPDDPNSIRYISGGSEVGKRLPEGAYDLVDRGNGWYTYSIKIDSTTYKMLTHVSIGTRGTTVIATTVLLKNDAID